MKAFFVVWGRILRKLSMVPGAWRQNHDFKTKQALGQSGDSRGVELRTGLTDPEEHEQDRVTNDVLGDGILTPDELKRVKHAQQSIRRELDR